jgi:hypothetical protein
MQQHALLPHAFTLIRFHQGEQRFAAVLHTRNTDVSGTGYQVACFQATSFPKMSSFAS